MNTAPHGIAANGLRTILIIVAPHVPDATDMLRVLPAALCILAVSSMLHAQQPDGDRNLAALAGRVVNVATGDPIRKASVRLSLRGGVETIGTTDADGKFRFKHLLPGEYNLSAEKSGFEGSDASILTLRAGDDLKDLKLQLSAAAAVSGRVLDEDGDPVPNAEVTLWYRQNFLGQYKLVRRRSAKANDKGEFRMDGLLPGRCLLSAGPNSDLQASNKDKMVDSKGDPVSVRDAVTYYPNALLIDEASAIDLVGGAEMGGADIRLRRSKTYRISGKIADLERFAIAGASVSVLWPRTGVSELAKLSQTGEFSAEGFLPGRYELSLSSPGKGSLGRMPVEVTDTDVTGVTIKLYVPSEVDLHVVAEREDGKPLPFLMAFLRKNPVDLNTWCEVEDGVCTIHNVEPGKYTLDFRGKAPCYIKSIRSGAKTFSARAVDVPEGVIALDVVLSDAMAQIDGEVINDGDQHEAPSFEVALVPVTAAGELFALPRVTDLDQYGHFSFHDLPPGTYRLYAEEELGIDRWSNPDLVHEMESMGTKVEIAERDKLHVQLNPIPKKETTKIIEKLGLQ